MPLPQLPSPALRIPIEALSQESFAPFGTIIGSALPFFTHGGSTLPPLPPNAVHANQGTAIKHLDVTHMQSLYEHSSSPATAKAVMNVFSCAPRKLRRPGSGGGGSTCVSIPVSAQDVIYKRCAQVKGAEELLLDVRILERHPFTVQTFAPMGLDGADVTTCYLVVVAPTVVGQGPEGWPWRDSPAGPRGAGPPDLSGLRAFLARGSQAVTYGPGTWHAPMMVLGSKGVNFVVTQFANGVGGDDCQEVVVEAREGEEGVAVVIDVSKDTPIPNGSYPNSPRL